MRTAATVAELQQGIACAKAAPTTRYIVYLSSAVYQLANGVGLTFGGHIEIRRHSSAPSMPLIKKYRGSGHCSCALISILASANTTWIGIGVADGYGAYPYVSCRVCRVW